MKKPRVQQTPQVFILLKRIINQFGFEITRFRENQIGEGQINLNIGSSGNVIPGFINLDKPSDWYGNAQSRTKFVPYDATLDKLPYLDSTVSNIYISHVIEHLSDRDAGRLINESIRAIEPGGVIRICVPDAYFLWRVSLFKNSYWTSQRNIILSKAKNLPLESFDFLIDEMGSLTRKNNDLSEEEFEMLKGLSFNECMNHIQAKAKYDPLQPGNHVSWWTIEKIQTLIPEISKSKVVTLNSKFQGSISPAMVGTYFDKTSTGLSLYVELVKLV